MNASPKFLNPLVEIEKHGAKLPHWQQDSATYFVTFRLADSIPLSKLAPLRDARDAWLKLHPKPWADEKEREYHRIFTRQIESWLDAGSGACELRDPRAAKIAGDALNFFEGKRCRQYAWVVMPNHVHALFSLLNGHKLEDLLHSWKSFSANKINDALGRKGTLWQPDYHDRLIRTREHFNHCAEYIRKNPEHAKLHEGEFLIFVGPGLDGMEPGLPAPDNSAKSGQDAPAP